MKITANKVGQVAALLAISGLAALPLLLLAMRSLAQAWYWPALAPPAWSVRAWRYIFSPTAEVAPALATSSVIALAVTLLAVTVALPAARVLAWQEFRGKHAALFALLAARPDAAVSRDDGRACAFPALRIDVTRCSALC